MRKAALSLGWMLPRASARGFVRRVQLDLGLWWPLAWAPSTGNSLHDCLRWAWTLAPGVGSSEGDNTCSHVELINQHIKNNLASLGAQIWRHHHA